MSVLLNQNANYVESSIGKENTAESQVSVERSLFNCNCDITYIWLWAKNDNVRITLPIVNHFLFGLLPLDISHVDIM